VRKVTFLVAESGNVDFDGPVDLTKRELNDFLTLLGRVFDPRVVERDDVDEPRSERIGDRVFQRPWAISELSVLLEPSIGTEEMSKRLGRTWLSVVMKRGEFFGPFLEWTHSKGRSLLKGDVKKLITEYLNEKKLLATAVTRQRQDKRRRIARLLDERNQLKEERSKFNVFPRNTERYAARRTWVVDRLEKIPDEIADLERQLEE
jgi:hypothetical protein